MKQTMSERTTEILTKDIVSEERAGARAKGYTEVATPLYPDHKGQTCNHDAHSLLKENNGLKRPSMPCRYVGRKHVD
jgi:hypothetical protein